MGRRETSRPHPKDRREHLGQRLAQAQESSKLDGQQSTLNGPVLARSCSPPTYLDVLTGSGTGQGYDRAVGKDYEIVDMAL
jgi:hypothetical protein